MKILYGNKDSLKDVTKISTDKFKSENYILIPANRIKRKYAFGKVSGEQIIKVIYDDGKEEIFSGDAKIYFPKVSVVIPTYNRFKYLLNAIKSVKEQTYKNIEIIVVNDCSTQKEYYEYNWKANDINILHLPKNSKQIFGKICGGGNARNIGIMISSGDYIAFLDDDDYFLPTKIEKQIFYMRKENMLFSSTEGIGGFGLYDKNKKYKNYHYQGIHWNTLKNIFSNKNKLVLEKMYSNNINYWDLNMILIHNCIITSSIIINKKIVNMCGYFPLKKYAEDYAYWKKIFKYEKCLHIRESLVYIDMGHGDGQNY